MPKSRRTGHYVPSTHWDREWYESFQDYRFRLVNLLDEVLDTLDSSGDYRCFQMDGQSIAIEDYLEIRPERAEQVRRFAGEGRLMIGPWYVLPDEFLVSGESVIRNIALGIRVATGFGRASRAGFLCDMFGHISQLPQILRGFDIDNALLWRGVNESTHGAMFRWQAPDGSEVIAYRFSPHAGYCSFTFKVRHCHDADHVFDLSRAVEDFRGYLDFELERVPTDAFLVFDGGDHLEVLPEASKLIARANRQFKDVEIIHSHLDGFMEDIREQKGRITKTFRGELREPGEQGDDAWLIPGVLSSRVHLKQANARCETELCAWAEPFSTFASWLGRDYPYRYLEVAWRHLIQNHPHDSICGCSIDQVHKDMEYRFDQSAGISSHVTRDALRAIADRVKVPGLDEKDLALVVFNPSSDPVSGPVDLTIRFPDGIDTVYQEFFGFEKKIGFRLYDADDNELPYQYVKQRASRQGFRRPLRKFPVGEARHEVDVAVRLDIPAFGYTTVVCRPVKEPTRYLGTLAVDDHTIENEHLAVTVDHNGTITLTDKRNGETYPNLLTLEDRADIGDGWYHGIAVNERVHTSIASHADVALTADGIHKAALTIRVTMNLPERFRFDRMIRSETMKSFVVTHEVTLREGSDAVEVHTTVDNNIRDHRLRVLFPSGADAETCLADQAFDVVERPIALREDNARYKELEVETRPQQTWTAVHDDARGLAVVAKGLPEATVRDQMDRPIALTLFRSFIRAVMTSGNEGGEIQGHLAFDYQIVPLSGPPDVADLCRRGQRLAAGLRAVQLEQRDLDKARSTSSVKRDLPPARSFLTVGGKGSVITAVHRRDPGEQVAVRLFNPTGNDVSTVLRIEDVAGDADLTNFEGKASGKPERQDDGVHLSIAPRRIVTLRVK